jgi:lipoyl(octanoyl) transferase
LQVYLSSVVDFHVALQLQQRWVYEAPEDGCARLLLCEHPPILTVGRHGSHAHYRLDEYEQRYRPLEVAWLNRGAGCWLQTPGQLAIYPVFPLNRLGFGLGEYLVGLRRALELTLSEFDLHCETRRGSSELWANGRPIGSIGVAVRDWVTYHGAVLNLNPLLHEFRDIRTGKDHPPMTSLQRECRRPVRASLVRELIVEHLAAIFGFVRTMLFTEHPQLSRKAVRHALTTVG